MDMLRFRQYIMEYFTKGYDGKIRGKVIDMILARGDRVNNANLVKDSLGGEVRLGMGHIDKIIGDGSNLVGHDRLVEKNNLGQVKLKRRHIEGLISNGDSYLAHERLVDGHNIGRVRLRDSDLDSIIGHRDSEGAHIKVLNGMVRGKIGMDGDKIGKMVGHGNDGFNAVLVGHHNRGGIDGGRWVGDIIDSGGKKGMGEVMNGVRMGKIKLGDEEMGKVKKRLGGKTLGDIG
jgi:hypothetical protein